MKVDVTWNEEYHFVYIKTPVEFDISEWNPANLETLDLIREKKAPVHVVLNMLETRKHPINPKEILGGTTWISHPNLGWTVHIIESNLIRMLAKMTIHLVTAKYKQASSYEDAVKFLASVEERQSASQMDS